MWAEDATKLNLTMKNAKQRMRCIRETSLLDPELMSATTTAKLFDQNRTDFPDQSCPQSAADITMGIISRMEMYEAAMVVGHWNCIHLLPSKAPQPHFPDASAVTESWGLALSMRKSIEVPFQ